MSGAYKTPTGLGDKDKGVPATGREAAASAAPSAAIIRERALEMITAAGRKGLTADEVAERLDLDELSVRPRVSDLKRMELIAPNGERRKSSMGRGAAVMVAAVFAAPAGDGGQERLL